MYSTYLHCNSAVHLLSMSSAEHRIKNQFWSTRQSHLGNIFCWMACPWKTLLEKLKTLSLTVKMSPLFLQKRLIGPYTHTYTKCASFSSGVSNLLLFNFMIKSHQLIVILLPILILKSTSFFCHLVMGVTFRHILLKLRQLNFRSWNIIRIKYADTKDKME